MSSLSELLHVERHRPQMSDEGGTRIPAMLAHEVHPDLDEVVVSRYRDPETVLFVDDFDDEVRSAFFELEPEQEDAWMKTLVDHIYRYGAEHDWPAVARPSDWSTDVLDDIESCFDYYDVPIKKVFVGVEGLNCLVEHGWVDQPDRYPDEPFDDAEAVHDWRDAPLIGLVRQCPILWNPHLQNKLVWAASSDMVGSLDRVDDYVSICVHNPVRGLAILSCD